MSFITGATTTRTGPTTRGRWTATTTTQCYYSSPNSNGDDDDGTVAAAQEELQRTAAHLEKLMQQQDTRKRRRGGGRKQHHRPMTIADDGNNNSPNQRSPPPPRLPEDPLGMEREKIKQEYLYRAANALKEECKRRKLPSNGRKPDLAVRLAEDDLQVRYRDDPEMHRVKRDMEGKMNQIDLEEDDDDAEEREVMAGGGGSGAPVRHFAGLILSDAAAEAMGKANFVTPSPIQAEALVRLALRRESLILHAETGSGKTLAYLLPLTERLWEQEQRSSLVYDDNSDDAYGVVLTPTRELAAQVAGIATVLAPPGTVRLIAHPTNIMSDSTKDRGELEHGGRLDDESRDRSGRYQLFVGSAKSIMLSLYGDGDKMPASPTPKPAAMYFLRHVRAIVLDEVDRLLGVNTSTKKKKPSGKRHERPAAILAAAVARCSLGRAQVVAASATVGRPLKRELSRVLGLAPQDCPEVVRGVATTTNSQRETAAQDTSSSAALGSGTTGRAVTIPSTVQNYVVCVSSSGKDEDEKEATASAGTLLTTAYKVIQHLGGGKGKHTTTTSKNNKKRILLVLTRGFGIQTQNVIGALKHFGCRPQPQSLLDALQADLGEGDGTDRMIQLHRQVSRAAGVGETTTTTTETSPLPAGGGDGDNGDNNDGGGGYLLVTGEDTIRGLHLDGLDAVIIVGRPNGPDEYTHIAGRTGRAGKRGTVITVVGSSIHADAMQSSWKSMLGVDFAPIIRLEDISSIGV